MTAALKAAGFVLLAAASGATAFLSVTAWLGERDAQRRRKQRVIDGIQSTQWPIDVKARIYTEDPLRGWY